MILFYVILLAISHYLLCQSSSHLAAAEVLQEVGEALDDAGVFRTVSVGVTDEDFGAGPRPLRVQCCTVIGRLAALLVQLAVDVF